MTYHQSAFENRRLGLSPYDLPQPMKKKIAGRQCTGGTAPQLIKYALFVLGHTRRSTLWNQARVVSPSVGKKK
jgi:hypothetical protein